MATHYFKAIAKYQQTIMSLPLSFLLKILLDTRFTIKFVWLYSKGKGEISTKSLDCKDKKIYHS